MPRKARKTAARKARSAWRRNPRYRGLRPWKKGQSGNPKGRPKGARNKISCRMGIEELVRISKSERASEAVKLRATTMFLRLMMDAAGLTYRSTRWRD